MGKGTRKRQASLEAQQKQEQERQKQRKKHKRNVIIGVCCAAAAVIIAGASVGLAIVRDTGYFLRRSVCLETPNFQVDGAMFSYFFYSKYNDYVNYYADSLTDLGLDTSLSLKEQESTYGGTWFDYFRLETQELAQDLLLFAESAKSTGLELDEEDYSYIDAALESTRQAADAAGMELDAFLDSQYGVGVREDDVRRCLELTTLAEKRYEVFVQDFSVTDEELEAYCAAHPEDFYYCDYLFYTFTADTLADATSEEAAALDQETRALAEALAACDSEEAFEAAVLEQERALAEEELTEEDEESILEDIRITYHKYGTENEEDQWAFDAARQAGDTAVFGSDGEYTVYYLLQPQYRQEYITKNVRHILLTSNTYETEEDAEAKAEELLAQWLEDGGTAEAFAALARQYSEDTGSVTDGGLYANVLRGEMGGEFENWCYSDERAPGDTGTLSSSYGVHVMYFEGDGLPAWAAQAYNTLRSDAYDTLYEELTDTTPMTTNVDRISRLRA